MYLHIPFCKSRCSYCDFVSCTAGQDKQLQYVQALQSELRRSADKSQIVDTVYFGGGTPSVLSDETMDCLFQTIRECYRNDWIECTVECNPDDVTEHKIAHLRALGVTRISLGVQTMDDATLQLLGRRHDAATAVRAVELCSRQGMEVSVDLMLGLPMQTAEHIRTFIEQADRAGAQHISAYQLTLEDGTDLARRVASGQISLPNDDACADAYDMACACLHAHGYECYEISNFCRPAHACRHNMKYWTGQPYYGFGAAAHSLIGDIRYANPNDIDAYIRDSLAGKDVKGVEQVLTRQDKMQERIMLGLRLAQGIDTDAFRAEFGCDFYMLYADALKRVKPYLSITDHRVAILPQYRNVMNAIVVEFL